mgnify:CR=1 FL=1
MEHLHTHRRLYLASTPPTVQTALDELWQLRDSHELGLIKLLSARLLWEVKRQPVEASPSIRYFTRSQVAHCQGNPGDPVRRFEPEPHSARVCPAVSSERNQSEKLLPGRVRGKSLHIPAGGADAPGGRVAAGHRTAGAEIAAQVGYENQSKFAAVFARQFGCPPLEYRRRARLD